MTKTVDIEFEKSKSACPIIHEVEGFTCSSALGCPSKDCILKREEQKPTMDVEVDITTGNLIVYCYHGAKK